MAVTSALLAAALASCGPSGLVVPASRAALAALSSLSAQLSASQIAFGSSTMGWLAVTASLEGQPWSAVELLRTVDGGQSWHRQWATNGSVVQLAAFGTGYAWLSTAPTSWCRQGTAPARCARLTGAGELFTTNDGGRHWRKAWSGSGQLHQVVFVSASVGLASLQSGPCSVPGNSVPPRRAAPAILSGRPTGAATGKPC